MLPETDLLTADLYKLRSFDRAHGLDDLRDEIVRQARAAWERELAEVRRQAAFDALTAYAIVQDAYRTVDNYRDTHYAPTPRSVTLSDGSVVRVILDVDAFHNGTRLERSMPDKYARTAFVGQWASLLGVPTDTGADFDSLKAFAASVEGR